MNNSYKSSDPNKVYEWNVQKSNHAKKRSNQRGISDDELYLAMDYSEPIFKQGLIFYVVTEKKLPKKLDHKMAEKLNKMVVVISPRNNEIVTCYKAENSIRRIKRKLDRLES